MWYLIQYNYAIAIWPCNALHTHETGMNEKAEGKREVTNEKEQSLAEGES